MTLGANAQFLASKLAHFSPYRIRLNKSITANYGVSAGSS
jgi:hypothetical protein